MDRLYGTLKVRVEGKGLYSKSAVPPKHSLRKCDRARRSSCSGG